MRVVLYKNVLADKSYESDLDHIVDRIDRGAHEWEVDDPDDIANSAWLQGGRSHLRELFDKASTHGIYSTIHKQRVTVTAQPDSHDPWTMTPSVAVHFLDKPLLILLENEFSDAIFLRAVLGVLGLKEFLEYCRDAPNAIVCKGAGGIGEMPKHVINQLQEAQTDAVPLRVIVLVDSDATIPKEVSNPAQTVQNLCNQHSIPCCVLQKRAIENYMPDALFEQWLSEPDQTNTRPRIEAFLRLTPGQRDHFPVKKGLPKSPKNEDNKLFFSKYFTKEKANHPITSLILKTEKSNPFVKI